MCKRSSGGGKKRKLVLTNIWMTGVDSASVSWSYDVQRADRSFVAFENVSHPKVIRNTISNEKIHK